MNRIFSTLGYFGAMLLVATAASSAAVRAVDLSDSVILVASPRLDGSPFEQAVVLAAPLPHGRHFGFIINKPTGVNIETLLPDDAAAGNVTQPVYFGGPVLQPGIFAVTAKPANTGVVAPLMPGLFAALDSAAVDRVIETMPNEARYFVGLMIWEADELENEVSKNAWEVRPADADTVLRAKSRGLWNALRAPMASLEPSEAARPA